MDALSTALQFSTSTSPIGEVEVESQSSTPFHVERSGTQPAEGSHDRATDAD
jgi:hypothetical protein